MTTDDPCFREGKTYFDADQIHDRIKKGLMAPYDAVVYAHALGLRMETEEDPSKKDEMLKQTILILVSFTDPALKLPRASLELGVVVHKLALHELAFRGDVPEHNGVYLQSALRYFEKAAGMADYQKDFSPSKAKNNLARIYVGGVLQEKDSERAFALRMSAALDGFAEAQINLADMLLNGEGCKPNASTAYEWLSKAWDNRNQLEPKILVEVMEIEKTIRNVLAQEDKAPSRPISFQGNQSNFKFKFREDPK